MPAPVRSPASFRLRSRRAALGASIVAAAQAISFDAAAQGAFPARPIRIMVGFTAGGPGDVVARVIAPKLTEAWGQQVVVENRVGVSGNLASEAVFRAPADGHTLLMGVFATALQPSLYPKLAFDSLRDLTPVVLCANVANLLVVHPSLPVRSVKELIALAKARPRDLVYASAGIGTSSHLAGELMDMMAGTKMLHVPYKGSSQAHVDVIAGQVSIFFDSVVNGAPRVKEGRLRGLAVTTLKRSPGAPDIPTMEEAGLKGYSVDSWFGLMGPANLARDIVARYNSEVARIVRLPDVRERLRSLGGEPIDNTPEQFAAFLRNEVERWAKVIKTANIRVE